MSEPANILLVDDRPENLIAVEAVLEPLGQNLVRAHSGEEALKRLLHEDFALILLDVQMPGMDGFETAAHIKQRERTRHIPIIFLTAISTEPHHALRGYTAGAVDYLFKPFDPTVLRSKVSVFIELYRLRREAENLAHRALHDPLTDLPNRVLFTDRLGVALNQLRRRATTVAVTFIDLDGFKEINEHRGHEVGDQVLVEVARRLRLTVRPTDTVARFGGDEFTILSEGLDAADDAIDIAERIVHALNEPIVVAGVPLRVGSSAGLALSTGPDDDPDTLIRAADTAMYRAKQAGGARFVVFDRQTGRPEVSI